MNRSHQIRLVPNRTHINYFRRACGVRRYTFNKVLAKRIEMYKAGEKVNHYEVKKWFNATKRTESPFVTEVTKCAADGAMMDVEKAYKNFFSKRAKFPKFARKGENERFYIDNTKFRVEGKRILIPKLGWVRMREELRFHGKIMSAVVREVAGKWYVSISVELIQATLVQRKKRACGVDLGITDFATVSYGGGKHKKIKGPKALKSGLAKLRKLNKELSRRKSGSNRSAKTKLALSKAHWRIKCVRQDFLHKLSSKLVRNFTHIGVEDLSVKGMTANRCLARSISDQGWGEFSRQLEYKAKSVGSEIITADRFFPSSKMCRNCGTVNKELKLSDRKWACPHCESVHDRDANAADNLKDLALGLRVTARRVG